VFRDILTESQQTVLGLLSRIAGTTRLFPYRRARPYSEVPLPVYAFPRASHVSRPASSPAAA
jgi:hypothetical protein